jgi:hypothetical protein
VSPYLSVKGRAGQRRGAARGANVSASLSRAYPTWVGGSGWPARSTCDHTRTSTWIASRSQSSGRRRLERHVGRVFARVPPDVDRVALGEVHAAGGSSATLYSPCPWKDVNHSRSRDLDSPSLPARMVEGITKIDLTRAILVDSLPEHATERRASARQLRRGMHSISSELTERTWCGERGSDVPGCGRTKAVESEIAVVHVVHGNASTPHRDGRLRGDVPRYVHG